MRIALFATCIVDAMYPKVALATVRILERLGHEVVFPPGQVCCSQMHVNSGYMEDALPVVRNHVRTFMKADYDLAVAPSASCVASLGHQQPDVARSGGDGGHSQAHAGGCGAHRRASSTRADGPRRTPADAGMDSSTGPSTSSGFSRVAARISARWTVRSGRPS